MKCHRRVPRIERIWRCSLRLGCGRQVVEAALDPGGQITQVSERVAVARKAEVQGAVVGHDRDGQTFAVVDLA